MDIKFIKYKNYYIAKVNVMPTKNMWYVGTFKSAEETYDNFLSVYGTHTLKAAKEGIDKGFFDNDIIKEYEKYSILYNKCINASLV